MSGFMKLLASMGMPIPRLADCHFVKDIRYLHFMRLNTHIMLSAAFTEASYVSSLFDHCRAVDGQIGNSNNVKKQMNINHLVDVKAENVRAS